MALSITIRLTPERARFIKLIKKRFNFKKNSEAIDLALRMSLEDEIAYKYMVASMRTPTNPSTWRPAAGKPAIGKPSLLDTEDLTESRSRVSPSIAAVWKVSSVRISACASRLSFIPNALTLLNNFPWLKRALLTASSS